MHGFARSDNRDRLKGALAAGLVQAAIGWLLIVGLAHRDSPVRKVLPEVFAIAPEPDPTPVARTQPHRVRSTRPEGAAAPPNLRSKATQVVAPPPIVIVQQPPPPVVVAPQAGTGAAASTGNADIPGPGTGTGGVGTGTGSGGAGDGDGAGGDETPPRRLRGRLRDSDYPGDLGEAGISGTVSVRYLVGTDGRVRDCSVDRSSGSAELDRTTCSLIERRFRFAPSRDARGRPVPAVILEDHHWLIERVPEETAPRR